MTIRAKIYAALVLTVLAPVVTITVALEGMGGLGTRFADVEDRAARQALALELKFSVTDLNGWQTAYGYDEGRSRPRFVRARTTIQRQVRRARAALTDERERRLVDRIDAGLRRFLELDDVAYAALLAGRTERVRQIFLGPEIARFEAVAGAAAELASYEADRAADARRGFNEDRRDARRRLVAVGLGAAVLIVLLLITAQDVARAALERRGGEPRAGEHGAPPGVER